MKMTVKVFTDPKHLAWATWTLLANNPINNTMYLVFCFVDLVIMMFYSFVLLERVHFSNFTIDTSVMTLDQGLQIESASRSGIQMIFLRDMDMNLQQIAQQNFYSCMALTAIILGITIGILATIIVLAMTIKNYQGLDKLSYYKRTICLLIVMMQTFLFMPLFDIILRTMFATMSSTTSVAPQFTLGIVTVLCLMILMLYIIQLFNICVPAEQVPWCGPVSNVLFLNLLIKIALVVSVTTDRNGTYALLEVIALFIMQSFQACYRLFFAPSYLKEVDLFIKSKDFTVCLIFFIGIICKALGDQYNYDIVYFIIFIPAVTIGWMQFEAYRKQTILLKVKKRQLKLEVEYEFALYVMMTLVRDSMEDKIDSQKIFGQLMDLMLTHIEDCEDQLCICDELENFYELLRLKQLHNQEVFPLLREERKRYKKIIDDQGLVGTISNLTEITLKQTTSESGNSLKSDQDQAEERNDNNYIKGPQKSVQSGKQSVVQTNSNPTKKKKTRTIYKININETKHRFLSELLYLYYFEMKAQFPDSFKIQLLSNYFALKFKKKEMLCVFQMRSFIKSKLSKLDQCCHYVNEQYLLSEIAKIQKVQMYQSQNQQEGNFQGEYFIRMNQLYKEFNLSIESLSSQVVNFWKGFERTQIDAQLASVMGQSIAKDIQSVFRIFQELDKLKILKDYQMYFQFAILQLHILNDPVAYELYIGKMKSILDINKVFQKNYQNEKNSDMSNFMVVDANGIKFGQLLQMNNNLRQLLGWSESDGQANHIENFMPALIREAHPSFIARYNKTGQSYIINNKVTQFIKIQNGFTIPVQLYIKFHYSIDYQYTFLAIIKPFYEMSPFTNLIKYNMNQLMFFIVDNQLGYISEYSESCKKILKFKNLEDQDGITKRIQDFIIDFNFLEFKKTRQDRYRENQIYEKVHKIDTKYFENSSDNIYNSAENHFSEYVSTADIAATLQTRIANVNVRIFEERYSGGVLDMNIFCLTILTNGNVINSGVLPNLPNINNIASIAKQHFDDNQDEMDDAENPNDNDIRDNSSSLTGSSSHNSSSNISSMNEFRNFHSFTEQATPHTLWRVTQLIAALYLIMALIASVNLGINLARQQQSENDVGAVRLAFDRTNRLSMNQLVLRVLVNTANGYEPDASALVPDRFLTYMTLSKAKVQQLKDDQSQLQLSTFAKSDSFVRYITGSTVSLAYLSTQNTITYQNQSLDIAMNLYISKLTELTSLHQVDLRGNLRIQSLAPRDDPAYQPSYNEQLVYFVVQNGNIQLRQAVTIASQYYIQDSMTHAQQNITSTKITAIISIITIIIIGLVIAPMLTKAEIRKYMALLYFLKIPRVKLTDMIKNCEYCLNMNDENRYYQIQKDYESFLGIKLIGQQVEDLKQSREERANLDNQDTLEEISNSSQGATGGSLSMSIGKQSGKSGRSIQNGAIAGPQSRTRIIADSDWMGSVNSDARSARSRQSSSTVNSIVGKQINPGSKNSIMNNIESVVREEDIDLEDDVDENEQGVNIYGRQNSTFNTRAANRNKFNAKTLNLGKQDKKKVALIKAQVKVVKKVIIKKKSISDSEPSSEEDIPIVDSIADALRVKEETRQKDEDEKEEAEQMTAKTQMINNQATKRRLIVVVAALSVIIVLSSYFIIAYFLAMKTLQASSDVISELEIIFQKGSCFDSAVNFMRENQIRNQTVYIPDSDTMDAADYYLNLCFQSSTDYNSMRTNIPVAFKSAQDFIDNIETPQFCQYVYGQSSLLMMNLCNNALNGILTKGLSNAFYFMFTQILNMNLSFLVLGQQKVRTLDKLMGLISETNIIQMIDMKAVILDLPLTTLEQQCSTSVDTYIQKLLSDSNIGFAVFIIILTFSVVALIYLGFRVLRQSMWNTNIILKIIPFETLPREERIQIKDFFNS